MKSILFFSALGSSDLMAPDAPVQNWKPWTQGALMIVAAVLVLFCLALAVIWAVKGRKSIQQFSVTAEAKNAAADNGWFGFKKRRRKYKKRFPTLAENGGLPPRRKNQDNQEQTQSNFTQQG
ncbi:MAG: hypothetical protein ACP5MG_10720 [Verrucomicrobiia bacterium]|jgi:hypothetical protein